MTQQQNSEIILKINNNGFVNFPPFTQILPTLYIVIAALQATFFVSITANYDVKIPILLIFYILFAILAYLWYITTSIDPTDPVQIHHRYHIKQNIQFNKAKYKFYCNTCNTCVGNHSFHCKKCNRCVQLFDHHCKWLNNCIGAKNYFEFVLLVTVCLIFVLYHFSINIWYCVRESNNTINWSVYFTIAWIIIDFVPLGALGWLFCLHIYLIINKKSTIALIMEQRQKNKIHPQKNNSEEPGVFKQSLFRLRGDQQTQNHHNRQVLKEEVSVSENNQKILKNLSNIDNDKVGKSNCLKIKFQRKDSSDWRQIINNQYRKKLVPIQKIIIGQK